MGKQSCGEKRLNLTAAQTNKRIEELRRVFDEGFLSQDAFETMKREIEDRVTALASDARR